MYGQHNNVYHPQQPMWTGSQGNGYVAQPPQQQYIAAPQQGYPPQPQGYPQQPQQNYAYHPPPPQQQGYVQQYMATPQQGYPPQQQQQQGLIQGGYYQTGPPGSAGFTPQYADPYQQQQQQHQQQQQQNYATPNHLHNSHPQQQQQQNSGHQLNAPHASLNNARPVSPRNPAPGSNVKLNKSEPIPVAQNPPLREETLLASAPKLPRTNRKSQSPSGSNIDNSKQELRFKPNMTKLDPKRDLNGTQYSNVTALWCVYACGLATEPPDAAQDVALDLWGFKEYAVFDDSISRGIGLLNEDYCIIALHVPEDVVNFVSIAHPLDKPFLGRPEIGVDHQMNMIATTIAEGIREFIYNCRAKDPLFPVIITGHSLGGALAVLVHAYLLMDSDAYSQTEYFKIEKPGEAILIDFSSHKIRDSFNPVYVNAVYTFGQPRTASQGLRLTLKNGPPVFRAILPDDAITAYPYDTLYAHAGIRVVLSDKGPIIGKHETQGRIQQSRVTWQQFAETPSALLSQNSIISYIRAIDRPTTEPKSRSNSISSENRNERRHSSSGVAASAPAVPVINVAGPGGRHGPASSHSSEPGFNINNSAPSVSIARPVSPRRKGSERKESTSKLETAPKGKEKKDKKNKKGSAVKTEGSDKKEKKGQVVFSNAFAPRLGVTKDGTLAAQGKSGVGVMNLQEIVYLGNNLSVTLGKVTQTVGYVLLYRVSHFAHGGIIKFKVSVDGFESQKGLSDGHSLLLAVSKDIPHTLRLQLPGSPGFAATDIQIPFQVTGGELQFVEVAIRGKLLPKTKCWTGEKVSLYTYAARSKEFV